MGLIAVTCAGKVLINLVWASSSLSFLISVLRDSKLSAIFSFGSTLVLMILALFANISVDIVSPRYAVFGDMLASSLVLEFPLKESFRKNVNLESLNGMYFFFFPDSTKEQITLLRVSSDLLMLQPYFNLSPSTLVSLIL